jgi:hypothetical protein
MRATEATVAEHAPPRRPKPRRGSVTGHHARRRARSVEADRTQRARDWMREV